MRVESEATETNPNRPPLPANPSLDRTFAAELLKTFDDPQAHGVHILFNQWWQYAPADVIETYKTQYLAMPGAQAFVDSRHFADQLDLDDLERRPKGSLGHEYFRFLTENRLEKNLAVNYRAFHEMLEQSGDLDRMPDDIKYGIIRGFQQHDILHVLTGYKPDPTGEISLQAYCLAQTGFPYFGMWLSVVTTRMTFLTPHAINATMDWVTHGWTFGRNSKNIQFTDWEGAFDRPLSDIRADYGLTDPRFPEN